ncbi:hypothetical protein ANO14919_017090 [Xylariales sp. No.14919]|nr:hypothetical protein F5X98DRAFT_9438 [Xylaria grammica]GAW12343.1 hypothetical protein ANO14919_017090 [Xylariales sp. No.14919]
MPPRRSHKKSRAGCRRCKVRKIKCDEVHPRCGNCSKHGVSCDFEHPSIRDAHAAKIASISDATTTAPTETPRPPSSASASASAHSPATHGDSPTNVSDTTTPTVFGSTPVPIYKTPEVLPLSSTTSKKNRMLELKLLHNFTTVTAKTLSISSPVLEKIWRVTVPELAFSSASYLADTLLAVSALHLRSSSPHDRELIRASHSYMASACSEYGASLSRGVTESNAEALFLTAALIAFQSTATRIFTRDDINDRTGGYSLPLSWFHSFQGVKAVVAATWQWLCTSTIVIPIIESQPALNLDLSGHPTFFSDLMVGVEDEVAKFESDPATQLETRSAYQHAIAVLDWAHKIPYTGAPLVFLATVSRRFIELLEARRPRALAILASYFALLKCLDDVWWLKGVARREIMGIVSLFDPDDEEWWPRLQWPLRIALHDNVIIPPQIWGRDWAAQTNNTNQSGGFVSHITLLSDMFSSMPQMNGATPDLEPAHQYIVEQEGMMRDILLPEGLEILPVD